MAASDDINAGRTTTMLVGICVLALLGYGIWALLVRPIYRHFSPNESNSVSLALAVGFDPTAQKGETKEPVSRLLVWGTVLVNGKPPKEGEVRISVEDWQKELPHSIVVPLDAQGTFESKGDRAFQSFKSGDRMSIQAEYQNGDKKGQEQVFLGAREPNISDTWLVVLAGGFVLFNVLFVWLLTGPPQDGKNNAAISISYLTMAVFMLAPLIFPDVLQLMSPGSMDVMKETPVGILIAKPSEDQPEQWVLNIAGRVVTDGQASSEGETKSSSPNPVPGSPQPVIGTQGVGESRPSLPTSDTDAQLKASKTGNAPISLAQGAKKVQTPGQPVQQQMNDRVALVSASGSPPQGKSDSAAIEDNQPGVTRILGGVVVPLYVLILSTLGGAINMTRKLPMLQKDASELAMGKVRSAVGAVGDATAAAAAQILEFAKQRALRSPSQSLESQVDVSGKSGVDSATAPPKGRAGFAADKVACSSTDSATPSVPAKEDEASGAEDSPGQPLTAEQMRVRETAVWREKLVTQHMYLISAPLLAIVVYYLLVWQNVAKPALLVMVSFSVGLMSEKIIKRILGIVEPIVDGGEVGPTPAPKTSSTT